MTLVDHQLLAIPTPVDALDATFGHLVDELRSCPAEVALRRSQGFVRRLEALETELLADRRRAGASVREVEEAAGRGSTRSAAEARKRSKRAEILTHNPGLATDLDQGRLTGEHLDALAAASEQTDGDAARDDGLVDRLANVNPDQARTVSRDWLAGHHSDADLESDYQRHRRLRKVSRYTTERGTKAIHAEGDSPAIDAIWEAIMARSRQLFDDDGGRDVPATKRGRTRDERLFDALHQLATGPGTAEAGDPGQPVRASAILVAPIDAVGSDGDAQAELLGTGVIPRSVLDRLMCNADLVGAIFSARGEPLWLGRRVRTVTAAQWRALLARDKGCVLCGAHPNRCEAHHLIPFEAPAKGRTDITNLVLLCTDCHHHTHETRQTVERHPDTGTWQLRPATPDELPPTRTKPPP
ncbi:MAG: DUF222 domain-containing protein [Acidimicrobiales bacterium]